MLFELDKRQKRCLVVHHVKIESKFAERLNLRGSQILKNLSSPLVIDDDDGDDLFDDDDNEECVTKDLESYEDIREVLKAIKTLKK